MPTYEYICKDCGDRFDHFQSMSSAPLTFHPNCLKSGKKVERIISGGTGLIFKGSGFYLTDYKNNNKKDNKNPNTKADKNKNKKSKTTKNNKGDKTA